jgi:catechol 2,3-dioxygenase-like lactoylglutathione lyase family enzyme
MLGGALAAGVCVSAQVALPNASGISAAHEHLIVSDQAASSAFWTALSGTPIQIGTMNGMHLPNIYVLFQANRGRGGARAQTPVANPTGAPTSPAPAQPAPAAGGSPATVPPPPEGSVVDALGFKVKSLKETLARLDALGVKPEPGATATTASVISPEKVRILLTQDPSISAPAISNEVLMKVPNPAEAAAWYGKWFGAGVVKQGNDPVAQIPGMSIRFVETKEPLAGTRGRALDHIGFEVKNLQAFAAKLQEGGVTINTPFRTMSLGFLTAITFVTDPWGTYIELNEGYPSGDAK